MGDAAGLKELPWPEAVVAAGQLAGWWVVWPAEHLLQGLDQRGVTVLGLLIGRNHQPLAPGDPGVDPLHRRRDGMEIAAYAISD